jgi:hypothetical protein
LGEGERLAPKKGTLDLMRLELWVVGVRESNWRSQSFRDLQVSQETEAKTSLAKGKKNGREVPPAATSHLEVGHCHYITNSN